MDHMAEHDAPAWMACEDIITRLKDELILEAIDLLHEEIKAKRIDISGYVSLLPDKSDEIQRDMYIINNLVERQSEILEQYRPFLEGKADHSTAQKVARIEELRKFVLSVQAISTLMKLSSIAESWAEDTGKYSGLTDPLEIMLRTISMSQERSEVLDFVVSSSKFARSEALTKKELDMLREAQEHIQNHQHKKN